MERYRSQKGSDTNCFSQMAECMVRIDILDTQRFKVEIKETGSRVFRVRFHILDGHELVIIEVGGLKVLFCHVCKLDYFLLGYHQSFFTLTRSLMMRLNHMDESLHVLSASSKAIAIGCCGALP